MVRIPHGPSSTRFSACVRFQKGPSVRKGYPCTVQVLMQGSRKTNRCKSEMPTHAPLARSLGCFCPSGPYRRRCQGLVAASMFNQGSLGHSGVDILTTARPEDAKIRQCPCSENPDCLFEFGDPPNSIWAVPLRLVPNAPSQS